MLIILTWTIQVPQGTKNLAIMDTNIRLQQYLDNIIFLITKSKILTKIVFCESSGYQNQIFDFLKQLAELYNKQFEYLTFEWNNQQVIKKGRGYGEQEILEYFLVHSQLIKEETSFIKLTGRYQVKNIDEVLSTSKDLENAFSRMIPWEKRCSTAFFKINITIFNQYLKGCAEEVNDEKWADHQLEGVYYRRLQSLNLPSWEKVPIFEAQTGSGYHLKSNILKDNLKQLLNLLWCYRL